MVTARALDPMVAAARSGNPHAESSIDAWRARLWRLCLASLPRFVSIDGTVLVRSLSWDGHSWTAGPPSPPNTANALVALCALRRSGYVPPLEPAPLLDCLVATHLPALDYSALACALWADVLGESRYVSQLRQALESRLTKGASQSMHLAWALAALSSCTELTNTQDYRQLADWVYGKLAANQSERTGLFHASATREGWLRRRRPISTLSSQTYPTYALAVYGRVFGVADALRRATRCADAVCRMQGPEGEWWWRYDVRTGDVVEQFPVYAVNQDTAIPLAFGELGRATGSTVYDDAVARGLAWLFGANEVGVSLVDEERSVIWRAVESRGDGLNIVREMHSYHPARCLFGLLATGGYGTQERRQ